MHTRLATALIAATALTATPAMAQVQIDATADVVEAVQSASLTVESDLDFGTVTIIGQSGQGCRYFVNLDPQDPESQFPPITLEEGNTAIDGGLYNDGSGPVPIIAPPTCAFRSEPSPARIAVDCPYESTLAVFVDSVTTSAAATAAGIYLEVPGRFPKVLVCQLDQTILVGGMLGVPYNAQVFSGNVGTITISASYF